MSMKRTFSVAAALLALLAPTAFAAPAKDASLLIRHQVRGCHSWAVNGGAFKATQSLRLGVGGTVTITNTDVMPHTLVQLAGPRATLHAPAMARMSAVAKVTFRARGVYVLGTKAGEDYMKGVKTTGEDNVLRLVVTVR